MPKISVIIPIYNSEKYLNNCIDSILRSTLNDIELILVNDGSTDNSPKICDEYAQKDKRVIVIHQENKRQAHARNQGLKIAKGEYISFIDADDHVDITFFEKLYNSAKKSNSDIVVSNVTTIPSSVFNYVAHWSFYSKNKYLLTSPTDKLGPIYSCAVWNKIYKNTFLKKFNLYFNEEIFLEDVTFNQIATILANNIYLEKDAMYFYNCENESSFMHSAHKSEKILQLLQMTQETKRNLTGKCEHSYFAILDDFEIYNLWGWFCSIKNKEIKKEYFNQMKKIFNTIDIQNNHFINEENKIKHTAVVNQLKFKKEYLKLRLLTLLTFQKKKRKHKETMKKYKSVLKKLKHVLN